MTKDSFNSILNTSVPVMAMFYSTACEKCLALLPELDEVAKEYGGRAKIVTVDGTENQDLNKEYHIDSYPTWILFKDGQQAWRDGGVKSMSEIKDMIDRFR